MVYAYNTAPDVMGLKIVKETKETSSPVVRHYVEFNLHFQI